MTNAEAIETLRANYPDACFEQLREAVDAAIEALKDAQPERKKGEWIPQNFNKSSGMITTAVYYYPKCSVCGGTSNNTNFCPNCGADMRGDLNETIN